MYIESFRKKWRYFVRFERYLFCILVYIGRRESARFEDTISSAFKTGNCGGEVLMNIIVGTEKGPDPLGPLWIRAWNHLMQSVMERYGDEFL